VSDERIAHLGDIARFLWPAPHVAVLGAAPGGDAMPVDEFLVLPNRRRPRVLAPTDRRTAAAVVRHHGEGRHARARMASLALALALRGGLGTLLRRERLFVTAPEGTTAATLLGRLREVLGPDVVMGMHLGPPRANRKPVIQLLDARGQTLAYAKIAVDDLTDRLVRTEAAALAELASAGTGAVEVPGVRHSGVWQGRALLVQAALPVWLPRRPLTASRMAAAVAEVAAIGRLDGVPLTASDHWAQLTKRLQELPPSSTTTLLRDAALRLAAEAGDVRLSFGASHGDWTPWNMACVDDRLLVWDWERFRHGIPVGADLLHHGLQTDLVAQLAEPRDAADRLVADAAERLAPLGVAPRAARVTALTYGLDLAARYLADRQQEAGARLGDVGTWLVPAVAAGVTVLEEEQ
jgi:hypothetical protein